MTTNCRCEFKLVSSIDIQQVQNELYTMPCEVAKEFLQGLSNRIFIYPTSKEGHRVEPQHKVLYTLINGDTKYRNPAAETIDKAVAKIKLFEKNSDYLPKH